MGERMIEHTPGPWKLGSRGAVVADIPTSNQLAGSDDVDYYGGYLICESVTEANARLIAAAPELLEALQGMMHHHGYNQVGWPQGKCPACQKAHIAITKAIN